MQQFQVELEVEPEFETGAVFDGDISINDDIRDIDIMVNAKS
jgi:hypothetical protein